MKWFLNTLVLVNVFTALHRPVVEAVVTRQLLQPVVEAVVTRQLCTEANGRDTESPRPRLFSHNVHEDQLREQSSQWSAWSEWSRCRHGRRVRQQTCLKLQTCGYTQKVHTTSCEEEYSMKMSRLDVVGSRPHRRTSHQNYVYYYNNKRDVSRRQLELETDMQRVFRGFSRWGAWSPCQHSCRTVRSRYCVMAAYCSRRVIRQSAFCYTEGTHCQKWVRARMKHRKDPGRLEKELIETLLAPPLALHPADSRPPEPPPSCGVLGRSHSPRDLVRVVGGRPAPPGKWPWMVAVLNKYKEPFCGGTLVALRWVTTAAHCVRPVLYVRLGEHDLGQRDWGEVEMRVREAVIHPRYDPDTVVNDIALLRLPRAASPPLGHGIACLPPPAPHASPLAPHTACVILGWGKRRSTDVYGSRILQEAQITTVGAGVCRRAYWQYAITEDMVCAGRGRRDACGGDSGGPLLCRPPRGGPYYLQGITSFGDGCGKRGKFGIYTRTAGYVPWLHSVINHTYFD